MNEAMPTEECGLKVHEHPFLLQQLTQGSGTGAIARFQRDLACLDFRSCRDVGSLVGFVPFISKEEK